MALIARGYKDAIVLFIIRNARSLVNLSPVRVSQGRTIFRERRNALAEALIIRSCSRAIIVANYLVINCFFVCVSFFSSVGIPALLDVEDMVRLKKPEPRSVQCYVQMIFSKYRPKDMDMSNLIIA